MSTGVLVLGGMSAALLCAGVAGLVVKPTPRLAGRVRPYTIVARADRKRDDGIGKEMCWCHAACLEAAGLRNLHVTTAEFWEYNELRE